MAITHTLVSALPDNAADAAAGLVVSSDWNADHAVTSIQIATGTITASEPGVEITQTWNNAAVTFTASKVNVTNTASAGGSLLADWQVGGTSKMRLEVGGMFRFSECLSEAGIYCGADISMGNSSVGADNQGLAIRSDYGIKWSEDTTRYGTKDLMVFRDAAGVLAQRNGTNAQTHRVYGTYTDSSNYVRASLASSSTAVTLAAETAGTGADNVPVNITPAGTEGVVIGNFAQFTEMTAPAAGAANTARLFCEDNGSGKTRLMVQFASGAAQQIAIEP